MIGRAEDQAEPLVAEGGEVRVGLLHRDGVVGRDAREVEVLGGGVHEHDRQAKLQQPLVVLVRRVGLGVLPAGKDHSRHLPLEQHLDVLGLGHAPGPRAEHGVEAALRERAGDDLGERREDRVLELGHDQPDHARATNAEVRRPLVADHVERSQHRSSRRVGDAGLAVQDTADRRLADPGLLRDVCKLPSHPAILRQISAKFATPMVSETSQRGVRDVSEVVTTNGA